MNLRRLAPGLVSLTVVTACGDDGEGASTEAASGSTTSGSTTSGSTTDDVTTDGGALGACHQLPAAAIAQWVEGPELEPTGTSTPERIAAAGARTWQVALDLLQATDSTTSIAASPTSMTIALGLSYARYQGDPCGDQIRARMHFAEEGDALHQTLGASIRELEELGLPQGSEGEDPVVVGLRPSIWQLEGSLTSSSIYGAIGHQVSKASPGALAAIREVMNCVIEAQSEGLLVDFIPDDHPREDTVAYDVNVAYLQAPWSVALDNRGTLDFTRDGGGSLQLPAIGDSDLEADYYADSSLTMVDVGLRGGRLAAMMVLPKADAHADLAAFTAALTAEALADARAQLVHATVDLTLPKLTIDSTTIDYYEPLGFMCPLFTLREILHGATVQIDEKGLKAAAATAAESWMTGTGPPPAIAVVVLDRPFLFFVHDRLTGYVLYSGRYAG